MQELYAIITIHVYKKWKETFNQLITQLNLDNQLIG